MNIRLGLSAALLGASLMVGGAASAATVSDTLEFLGDVVNGSGGAKNFDADAVRAKVTCEGTVLCMGLDSSAVDELNVDNPYKKPATSSATGFVFGYSDLFYLPNDGEATERGFVNDWANPDFPENSGIKTTPVPPSGQTSVSMFEFTSNALYILFKIGKSPDVTIIKNGAYGTKYTFEAIAGEGSGLSHIVEFGKYDTPCEVTNSCGGGGGIGDVPLPAGMPLMLAGFGVMAFVARRKARKA